VTECFSFSLLTVTECCSITLLTVTECFAITLLTVTESFSITLLTSSRKWFNHRTCAGQQTGAKPLPQVPVGVGFVNLAAAVQQDL
jgi:hypothetical protein